MSEGKHSLFRYGLLITVLAVCVLVLAGAGTAMTVTDDTQTEPSAGTLSPDSTESNDTVEHSSPHNKGDTVVYDFREDERIDDGADSNVSVEVDDTILEEHDGVPLPEVDSTPMSDRDRVEKPWDALTRHESVVQVQMVEMDGTERSCTGTIVGEYHVLTAAHCVQFDAEFGGWVDEVSVVPMIDTQNGTEIEPYGSAEVRIAHLYEIWLDQQTAVQEHDFALLTLDRSLGVPTATTAMPWETYPVGDPVYTQDTIYNHGYPGEPPGGEPFPSLWEDDGEGLGHTYGDGTLEVDVTLTGGHSGGPLFHDGLMGNELIGVAAYTTFGTGFGPRISSTKDADLHDWVDSTEYVDPPDDKPEFVFEQLAYTGNDESWFNVSQTEDIEPGETEVTFEHTVRNVGTATGDADLTVREATDGVCEQTNPAVTSKSISTPDPFESETVTINTTFPTAFGGETTDVCLTVDATTDEFDDRPAEHNRSETATLSFEEASPVAFDVGDVRESGERDIIDAVKIQQYLAGVLDDDAVFNENLADVDRDGEITIIDAVFIQQYLAGLIDNGTVDISDIEIDAGATVNSEEADLTESAVSAADSSEETLETVDIQTDLKNSGGMGEHQKVELRIAEDEDDLGDDDTLVTTAVADIEPDGNLTVLFVVPEDVIDEGDWVGIYSDDDEMTTQF